FSNFRNATRNTVSSARIRQLAIDAQGPCPYGGIGRRGSATAGDRRAIWTVGFSTTFGLYFSDVLAVRTDCTNLNYTGRQRGADYRGGRAPLDKMLVSFDSLRASEPENQLGRSLAIKPTYGR